MAIAVIKTGGKQYKVQTGDIIKVEKLDKKPKQSIEFADILTGKKIPASIISHGKGKKIRIFKFKAKKGYRKTQGHRQRYTELKIGEIK